MSALVFIIEDDEDLSTIFADALETVGYQVEQIKDGLKAQQRNLNTSLSPFDMQPYYSILPLQQPGKPAYASITGLLHGLTGCT